MTVEHYLEYLALESILDNYIYSQYTAKGSPTYCEFWFANNSCKDNLDQDIVLNLKKLKNRITELQKELLEDYIEKYTKDKL
jgi:hypothetical protein